MSNLEPEIRSPSKDPKVFPVSRFISPLTNLMIGVTLPFRPEAPPGLETLRWLIAGLLLASIPAWLAKKEWSFYLVDVAVAGGLLAQLYFEDASHWLVSVWIWLWILLANRGLHGEILRKRAQLEAEQPGSSKGWWPEVF